MFPRHPLGRQLLLDAPDHVVDGEHRLRPPAVLAIDRLGVGGGERRDLCEPRRRIARLLVVGRRAWRGQAGELIGITRCRHVRPVRREGRDLQHEGLGRRHRTVDERHRLGREHIGQIVAGLVAVVVDRPVLVEVIVEPGIPVAADGPFAPARRRLVDRLIAVEVLAEEAGPIAGLLQSHSIGLRLVAVPVERGNAAVIAAVGEHPVVVRILTGQERRSRWAAQRINDVEPRHRRAGPLHGEHVRHEPHEVPRQVIDQHEDDVRAAGG